MYSETRPNLYTHPLHLFSTQEPYTCSITYLLHIGYTYYIDVHCVPTTPILYFRQPKPQFWWENLSRGPTIRPLFYKVGDHVSKVKLLRVLPVIGLITVNCHTMEALLLSPHLHV